MLGTNNDIENVMQNEIKQQMIEYKSTLQKFVREQIDEKLKDFDDDKESLLAKINKIEKNLIYQTNDISNDLKYV